MVTAVDVFSLLCLALNIALWMLLELVTNLRPVNDNVTNKTICKLKRHYFIYLIHQSLNFDVSNSKILTLSVRMMFALCNGAMDGRSLNMSDLLQLPKVRLLFVV